MTLLGRTLGSALLLGIVSLPLPPPAHGIESSARRCTITGTAGNDVLKGTGRDDVICGRGGNDVLKGRGGKDILIGGPGDDVLIGGPGRDSLNCGTGLDVVKNPKGDKVAANCRDTPPPPPTPPAPPTPPPPAPEEHAPIAVDDVFAGTEDTALVLPASGIGSPVENDVDQDGGPLTVVAVSNAAGVVQIVDGEIRYSPASNVCEPTRGGFDYTVSDPTGRTDVGRVEVVLGCVVDPPQAANDQAATGKDSQVVIDVLGNDFLGDAAPETTEITVAGPAAHGSVTFTATEVTYVPDADYCNTRDDDPDDSFTYAITGGSTATVSVAVSCANDTAPTASGLVVQGSDAAVGNTTLVVNDPTDGPPAVLRPHKTATGGLLVTASDAETPASVAVVPETVSTTLGGSAVIEADGDFTYLPPAGCSGATDSFTYTVTDQDPLGAKTATGTVQIDSTGCVWYVDNTASPGTSGTSADPFATLAQAQTASGNLQTIYVMAGDGTSSGYDAGIALKTNQRLLGEAVDLVMGGVTLAVGVPEHRPRLTATDVDVVKLGIQDTISGLDIDPAGTGSGIAGDGSTVSATLTDLRIVDEGMASTKPALSLVGSGGFFTIQDLQIDNTETSGPSGAAGIRFQSIGNFVNVSGTSVRTRGGPAVDIANAPTQTLGFTEVTSLDSTSWGVNLDGIGSGSFSASSGSISGAQGVAFRVHAGSGVINYPGAIDDGAGGSLEVTGRTGGSVTLSGPITDDADNGGGVAVSGNTSGSTVLSGASKVFDTGSLPAVSMTNSDGHTLSILGGGLDITATSAAGLDAIDSGTLAVTGSGNRIATTTGRALGVVNTDIAAAGLEFQSITMTGGGSATQGIVLRHTWTDGALTVTGAGGACTTASPATCSGGTIAGTNGADDLTDNATGTGILLVDTVAPSLTRMWIHDHSNYGIRAISMRGLTLANSVISGGADANLSIDTASGSGHAYTVTNNFLGAAPRDQALIALNGSGSITMTGNVFANDSPSTVSGGGGVGIYQTNTASSALITVQGNHFSGAFGPAFWVDKAVNGGTQQGTFTANEIGVSGVPNSGSREGSGLRLRQVGGGTMTWTVTNNKVWGYNNHGIEVVAGGGGAPQGGALNTVVTGNTIAQPGTNVPATDFPKQGIHYNVGTSTGDTFDVCADLQDNSLAVSGADPVFAPGSEPDIRLRQRMLTKIRLPGYAGNPNDDAAVRTFVANRNLIGGTPVVSSQQSVASGGGGFVASSPCVATP